MNAHSIQTIIVNGISEFSNEMIIIASAVIVVIVAFVVLKLGLRALQDESFSLGGFYFRKTPYRGYNRWRSKSWNMKNTM